jgi:hypothetical protein
MTLTLRGKTGGGVMPDSLRFILVVAILAGLGYGAAWYLSSFPPAPTQVVKALPHDRFNN